MNTQSDIRLTPAQERNLILLVAMVQFVNILDFMMVMPLGPDFATALHIGLQHIGIIAGAYTFSAAISGLVAAPFLDQFARKRMMLLSLGGVIVATIGGAFSWNLESMLAARIVAGIFGGQMFALSQAVIADFIPAARRGVAMGKVAGGFAVASIVGLPFGLELAARFGWQAPFIATGLIGILVWFFVLYKLPYHAPFFSTHSLDIRVRRLFSVFKSRMTMISYGIMGFSMMAGFMIIPNISAHFQMNLGYPRAQLGLLYLYGGVMSLFGMRLSGKIMDRYSATKSSILFTTILIFAMATGFLFYPNMVPTLLVFICFMVGMSGRNIAATALSSKVPPAAERGAYMSLQSTVTNLGSALGGYYSSLVLSQEDGHLLHVKTIALTAIILSCIVPFLVAYVEHHIRRRVTPPIAVPPV
ncbi:MAG: MFS transporter [Chthoniobacteraceae bacterium]